MPKKIIANVTRLPKNNSYAVWRDACLREYERLTNSYHKIYDRASTILTFCSILLPLVINKTREILATEVFLDGYMIKVFFASVPGLFALVSLLCISGCVVILCVLMMGRGIPTFDIQEIRRSNLARLDEDMANTWMVGNYLDINAKMQKTVERKQKLFNIAMLCLTISILMSIITFML